MIDHQALRRDYLLEIARRLRGAERGRIVDRAEAVIRKWEASASVRPQYINGWRAALQNGAEAVEEIALSRSPDALDLQHCMPFAGILSNRERLELRRKH